MEKSDIAQVAAMEAAYFVEPWSADAFEAELAVAGGLGLVAADESGAVMGYITARVVVGEAYINTIAVGKNYRGRGIARAILSGLEKKVGAIDFITLEARESNHRAISLYSSIGYKKVGERKNFYREPVENAVLMTKKINANLQ